MMNIKNFFYRYIYYAAVLVRREWIWNPRKKLNRSQYISPSALRDQQLERLNKILAVAQTSRYYKMKRLPFYISSLNDVANLPFLEKEDLREHAHQLETQSKPRYYTVKTSGGSTGAPVTLKKPAKAMASELAATWRGYSWAGIDIGDLQARFWGIPMTEGLRRRAKLIDFVARRERFSAFKFDKNDLDDYVELLIRKQPTYFYGYASMIHELALHMIERKRAGTVSPKAIITTSEVLTPVIREAIEAAFQCRVFNEYGCGEVGTIAHECEHGKMHVNAENVFVEIVDEDGTVLPEGRVGEIVVSDLNNDYMPLIRYRLRDFGSLSNASCECGRTLPILNDVMGRAYDFIENEKGQRFHGEFFLYIVEDLKAKGVSLKSIQFIKHSSHLEVLIVANPIDFNKAAAYITKIISSEFSQVIPVEFKKVEKIEREDSGKLRVIKSLT